MTTAAPPIIPAPNLSAGTPRDDHQEDPKHSGTRRHHCRDPGQDVRRHLNTSSAGLLGESVLGTVPTQAGTGWVLLDWFCFHAWLRGLPLRTERSNASRSANTPRMTSKERLT